ncbi:MAG: cysteine synthase family protein [Candidatus Dadabacteria bacterium]|nr:MAG: cysteine synthase family protein [Candidatus Dadabacteria bacterium]
MEIGNTDIVNVEGIYAKLECSNPCGSIKDRIAYYILTKSQKIGILKKGMTIVEASSGNTGIAISYYGRKMGFPVTIVMPENMTEERKEIIRANGANLILCSKEGSFAEAAKIRDEMASSPDFFSTDQFSNPLNVECHKLTTGQEIILQMQGKRIDAFVAGVGTGGTLIGVGSALKEHFPNIRIVAVEPAESAVMSGKEPAPHGIPGIGDGFIPDIVSDGKGGITPLIDEIITIRSKDAQEAAQMIASEYGLCVGISSGANFLAALTLKARGLQTVTVFPDGFNRYKSLGLSKCKSPACSVKYDCNEILNY